MSDPVELTPQIGVGSLVRLRTETVSPWTWAVVKVGKWWPNRGKVLVVNRRDGRQPTSLWLYPAELELVTEESR